MPECDPVEHLGELGMGVGEFRGTSAYLVCEQQLTTGRGPDAVRRQVERALVTDGERADLLHGVTPELHPKGMIGDRGKDIDDAAADRELAPSLDEVDPAIGRRREPRNHIVQLHLVTGPQRHRFQIRQPPHLRLEYGTNGRDDHPQGGLGRTRISGVHQAAQHGESPPDGVGTWRQPLVRQGFPGWEQRYRLRLQDGLQSGREVFSLASGGRDRQYRAAGTGQVGIGCQRGHHERA